MPLTILFWGWLLSLATKAIGGAKAAGAAVKAAGGMAKAGKVAGALGKLKEAGAEFRLANNGATILVPSARVDELRLSLARDGLPKSGRIGFEIFDKTNFGVTEFAEQVNYRRALEGELERTMMSLAEVDRARVHITFPKDSVFVESREPAKASVLLDLRGGRALPAGSVAAITHLVASAVQGLDPGAVSIVDRQGRLLSRPRLDLNEGGGAPEASLEYRERIERALAAKLNQAIEPIVGASHFRTGVSVDCDMSAAEESEESFDPARSIMLSSQKTEELTTGSSSGGVPGTASNLPRPAPRSAGSPGLQRRTEATTYQASRKVRHVRQPRGGIRRISVAVIVDHNARWRQTPEGMRRVIEPPTAETLQSIRDIAAAVVGLVPDRGDQITVQALPFESTLTDDSPPPAAETGKKAAPRPDWENLFREPRNLQMIGAGALGVVLLAGLLAFLRRGRGRRIRAEAPRRELSPAGTEGGPPELNAASEPAAASGSGQPVPELQQAPETELNSVVVALRHAVAKDSANAAGALRLLLAQRK